MLLQQVPSHCNAYKALSLESARSPDIKAAHAGMSSPVMTPYGCQLELTDKDAPSL